MELLRHLLDGITHDLPDMRAILLTTADAAEHPNCRRLAADFADMLEVRVAPDHTGHHWFIRHLGAFYERQWRAAMLLALGLDAIGPQSVDFVLLPHLESIGLLQLALHPRLFRGRPWATVAVGIRFHHRRSGIKGPHGWREMLQRLLFQSVVRHPQLVCLGSVNPYLAPSVQHPKVVWCPEPAATPHLACASEARRAYGIRPETCVVLVFGFIDRRKSVDLLLQAVAMLDPELDLTVFLAGTQHPVHMRQVLDCEAARSLRAHGRLVEANRYIMVGPDIDPMSVADIVWVYYERSFVYTGNVLARAARSRRAVVCRDQGVMGRLVAEAECGEVLSSDNPAVVAAALARLARDPNGRAAMGERGAGAFARNTPEEFAQPIVDAIARTLGKAPPRAATFSRAAPQPPTIPKPSRL